MAFIPDYVTGTVQLTTGTRNLVGTGTAWASAGIQTGDMFFKNGFVALVDTVNSNTSITLRDNWGGATLAAGNTYAIKYAPDQSRVQASVVALITSLSGPQIGAVKAMDISASGKLLYTTAPNTIGTSDLSAFARTLLDDLDATSARATLGTGGLTTSNSWTQNNFWTSGTNQVFQGTQQVQGGTYAAVNPWTDFWTAIGPMMASNLGLLGTCGSNRIGLYYNGYRNSSGGWTSLNIAGVAGTFGAAIEIGYAPQAILFSLQDVVSSLTPSQSFGMSDSSFYSTTTNFRDLGATSFRWRTIYLVNNPNVSSDARYKISRALTAAEVAAGVQLGRVLILYQWKDKVADEGAGVARIHAGIEAQTIASIMADHGLDAGRYGFWCADPLMQAETYTVASTYEKDVVELGEDGQPVYAKREVTEDVELERQVPVLDEDGEPIIYQSVRYGELSAFIAAAQAAHMDSLEARIAALEGA